MSTGEDRPFKFDFRKILEGAKKKFINSGGFISINLPFISFNFEPKNREKEVASEIMIRVKDKRVLNAAECCDDCIESSVESLQELRTVLVEKQVEISNMTDSPVYMLIELKLQAIRQFLTWEEGLASTDDSILMLEDHSPSISKQEQYFAALNMLRAHLNRCLRELSKIAEIDLPNLKGELEFDEAWQLKHYKNPELGK